MTAEPATSPALYDRIGSGYGTTRCADPGIAATLAQHLQLRAEASYLDLACGTGNYTIALADLGGRWHGIDASDRMLEQARRRNTKIDWRRADVAALPFAAHRFDGVVCTLAIHHFRDLHSPFAEVARVLRSGPFVVFTGLAEQMRHYWLGHYFPQMMQRSIEAMPTRDAVVDALCRAGFETPRVLPFHVKETLQDRFLYAGKRQPELYLHEAMRANISSFATLCPPQELQAGLSALRADIEGGRFSEIARRYADDLGDYAFVIAHKGACTAPAAGGST